MCQFVDSMEKSKVTSLSFRSHCFDLSFFGLFVAHSQSHFLVSTFSLRDNALTSLSFRRSLPVASSLALFSITISIYWRCSRSLSALAMRMFSVSVAESLTAELLDSSKLMASFLSKQMETSLLPLRRISETSCSKFFLSSLIFSISLSFV